MSNVQVIKDIVTQLERLQIQQSELIQRIGLLVSESNQEPPQQISAASEFAVGDRVRIKNPRFLQSSSGRITRITHKRITVLAGNGTSIVRAHKNIILVQQQE